MVNTLTRSINWRVVIPNLTQYQHATVEQLRQLKFLILQRLRHRPQDRRSRIKSQFDRGLCYYHIALQHHANGVPHLDILLIYNRSLVRRLTDYDYLLKHGDVTTYRKLNEAILKYGSKQDSQPLSNLPAHTFEVLRVQQLRRDPYRYLQLQMLRDPLHFNLEQYVRMNDLNQYLPSWTSIKTRLRDSQLAAANLLLKDKPGFKFIDRTLVESRLSPQQLLTYDSWPGYQLIVNKLNQVILYKGDRDPKTLNLLITGLPNTGKSALVWHPRPHDHFNPISAYCSVYPIGMSQWFPKYQSDVYHCIYWNQAKLTSYSYDTILKLLDGSPLDLSSKGSVSRKVDNPLIIMTSNLTLEQMIQQKFRYNRGYIQMARRNLAVRIQNVVVPEGYNLFLLQRLLVSV